MIEPIWLTQRSEEVGIGDLVALDLLNDKDAIARIEAAHGTGAIRVKIVDSVHPRAIGRYTLVTEDQLLLRVAKAGSFSCTSCTGTGPRL